MKHRLNPISQSLRWWLNEKLQMIEVINKIEHKIYRHEKSQRALNKELQEINTMLPLLRDNHAVMPG
ncbi:MAG: hypothetical protein ACK5W1_13460 [Flavobacteriales bacterium]|jgi:hypothetical protein